MTRNDIIMFALPLWDGPFYSTALSLSKELARKNRVFYIDNPFTIKDVLSGFRKKHIRKRLAALLFGKNRFRAIDPNVPSLVAVTPGCVLPINFLPRGIIYNLFRSINNAIVKRSVRAAIRKYEIKDFIFINSYNPFYLDDIDTFRPRCKIYHCVDNISESKYVGKHGSALEQSMISAFDLTITTSKQLYDYAKGLNTHTLYLPNAADFNLFKRALDLDIKRPKELEDVNRQVVGYIGNIDSRVDYDILKALAARKDLILLLVGPGGEELKRSGLLKEDNVIHTGSRHISQLPDYLRYVDCGIIPFLRNSLTKSIYPLKLNEYLASGKPVVSTDFSPDLNEFLDIVKIADSTSQFVTCVYDEIRFDSDQKKLTRINRAMENTWEARVVTFWEFVNPFLKTA